MSWSITKVYTSPLWAYLLTISKMNKGGISISVELSYIPKQLTMTSIKYINPKKMFECAFETDHFTIGGDLNIHHPLWGSAKSCKKGREFLKSLSMSKHKLLNQPNPTRIDPQNDSPSCKDLTVSSCKINNNRWKLDYHQHDPHTSDHFHSFITSLLTSCQEETVYRSK